MDDIEKALVEAATFLQTEGGAPDSIIMSIENGIQYIMSLGYTREEAEELIKPFIVEDPDYVETKTKN